MSKYPINKESKAETPVLYKDWVKNKLPKSHKQRGLAFICAFLKETIQAFMKWLSKWYFKRSSNIIILLFWHKTTNKNIPLGVCYNTLAP